MATSFGGQSPAQRRKAQRETAQAVKRGESPLGGKFREVVRKATLRLRKAEAHEHFRNLLGTYLYYNDDTVKDNIYHLMDQAQILWTISADTEEIRDRASRGQVRGDPFVILWRNEWRNPWWYH